MTLADTAFMVVDRTVSTFGGSPCAQGESLRRLHKTDLIGYQASAAGGTAQVRLEGDRADLGGYAVTVARGELLH